jgi:predicted nucleotidyltransferase
MKFQVKKRGKRDIEKTIPSKDYQTAQKFAERIYKEMGTFIRGVILFGSAAKKGKANDIDLLVVLDDVRIEFNEEIVQTYRIILQKIIADTDPKKLHIQSMKFTSFWEYVRAGDPVATNILRYGVALIDTGFFDPLQSLLDQGKIRPSKESIATYYAMSPASLHRAKQHLLSAGVDLYWAVIDSAHAALMHTGHVPPSPDHVAEIMEKTIIKDGLVSKKSSTIMKEHYKLFKEITNRERNELSGKEYEDYKKKTIYFMKEMEKILRKKL